MPVETVLHVIPSVSPLRGGPSAMVRTLARDLARRGIDTHVATTDDDGWGTLIVPYGVPVVQDGVTYWYFPRQTRFYTFSWPLSSWLADHVSDFDVVHIHALFSYATLPAAFWANRRGVPYVVRPLGTLNEWGMQNRRPWLKRLSFRFLESHVIERAALVHYTSEQERVEAERLHVFGRPVVIPNALTEPPTAGAAGTLRERYPQLQGRRIILFLSRLDPKKGLDLVLQAFVRVRRQCSGVTLVIAGDGQPSFVDRLKADAVSQGIASDVVWTGFLTGEKKKSALADADVFVLPSYSENFGIAAVEAMVAGLPVVVSDRVAIWDDIVGAGAGLAVTCDAESLSEAIVALVGDHALCRAMGTRGQRLARERYSAESVTGKMIHAYNTVVS